MHYSKQVLSHNLHPFPPLLSKIYIYFVFLSYTWNLSNGSNRTEKFTNKSFVQANVLQIIIFIIKFKTFTCADRKLLRLIPAYFINIIITLLMLIILS
jgi:hypothetical protein